MQSTYPDGMITVYKEGVQVMVGMIHTLRTYILYVPNFFERFSKLAMVQRTLLGALERGVIHARLMG